ncbi:MAG: radical SAM protein [Acidimicrobiia bacterium]
MTGGEPFLVPAMAETLARLGSVLPVVVNSNSTLFGPGRMARLAPLVGLPVAVQVSLDSAEPAANDAARGAGNFEQVVDAITRLVGMGVQVRVATTVEAAPGRGGPLLRPAPAPRCPRRGPRRPARRPPGPGRHREHGGGGGPQRPSR